MDKEMKEWLDKQVSDRTPIGEAVMDMCFPKGSYGRAMLDTFNAVDRGELDYLFITGDGVCNG